MLSPAPERRTSRSTDSLDQRDRGPLARTSPSSLPSADADHLRIERSVRPRRPVDPAAFEPARDRRAGARRRRRAGPPVLDGPSSYFSGCRGARSCIDRAPSSEHDGRLRHHARSSPGCRDDGSTPGRRLRLGHGVVPKSAGAHVPGRRAGGGDGWCGAPSAQRGSARRAADAVIGVSADTARRLRLARSTVSRWRTHEIAIEDGRRRG